MPVYSLYSFHRTFISGFEYLTPSGYNSYNYRRIPRTKKSAGLFGGYFPSVICTRCTGFFCLAIIKGPPNDIYFIIEEPSKHYFTEKVSYSQKNSPEQKEGPRVYYKP